MGKQAMWHKEVRELVEAEAFVAWFRRYSLLREDLRNAREHHADLQMQSAVAHLKSDYAQQKGDACVFQAGDCEANASNAAAVSANIDNASFEALSRFETARRVSSEAWAAHDRLEKLMDDQRLRREEMGARLQAARRRPGPEASAEIERLAGQLQELESQLGRSAKDAEPARQAMLAAEAARDALWVKVEDAWSRAFGASMRRSELGFQARRARHAAETQFARTAAERQRIEALGAQAAGMQAHVRKLVEEYEALLAQGAEAFGAVLVDEFLFWPQQESVEHAWVVPLVDEASHLNIQVGCLQIYQVSRTQGLDFIEPLPDVAEASADARLQTFFQAAEARPARAPLRSNS